jgi:hypothetical protein
LLLQWSAVCRIVDDSVVCNSPSSEKNEPTVAGVIVTTDPDYPAHSRIDFISAN